MSQRRRRVTLKDVARRAGVSVKTASNVKNDWPYVSDDTRARVKQAMEDLGYRPSHIARSLKTGRSDTIGIIVPDLTNPFFSIAFRGCEDALAERNYSTFLCNTDENLEREQYYLDLLINQGVDGILLWGSRTSEETLLHPVFEEIPIISIDGPTFEHPTNITYVKLDNFGGASIATQHLLEQGYRKIAHITGAQFRPPARERQAGFRSALEAAGIPWDDSLVAYSLPSIGGGYHAAQQILESFIPEAIFCYNDLMAIGTLVALEEAGLNVPNDVAVVGWDDIPPASLVSPVLTTIQVRQYELGQFAVEQLFNRFDHFDPTPRTVEFPVTLAVRNSSRIEQITPEEHRDLMKNLTRSPIDKELAHN